MADKVTIINRGLALLGAEPINDLTDDTPEAKIANRIYDESRKSILSEVLWNFATKRVLLNQVVGTPVWSLDAVNFIFQLPSDVIRVHGINSKTAIWRIEGEQLLSNATSMGIIYVYDLTDTTKYTGSFVDAFADKLAADMAYAVLNSNTEAKAMLDKYESVSLPKATAENSQEGTPPDVDDSLWVLAKYGYAPVNRTGIVVS